MNISLYLLTVLIWGTTWIALKLQLGDVAIPVSIVYRFALAALVLFAFLLLTKRLQPVNRRGQLICLAQGVCLFCVNFMCFYTASQWIPSGLIAVVFSTSTLWNALNARVFFRQKIAGNVMAGGAMGLIGLACLFWPELSGHSASRETLIGLGLALLGTLCFSAGNMAVEPATESRPASADHQCVGNVLRGDDTGALLPAERHAVHLRMEHALRRLTAVSGYSRLGDCVHRLPDPGRAHGAGTRSLLHCAVPDCGAEHLDVGRRLPVDRGCLARACAGDGGCSGRPGRLPSWSAANWPESMFILGYRAETP